MRTVVLGKTPYRVLKRRRFAISLQPMDSEYPHSLLLQDPMQRARWGHSKRSSEDVDWYHQLSEDVFEKIGSYRGRQ